MRKVSTLGSLVTVSCQVDWISPTYTDTDTDPVVYLAIIPYQLTKKKVSTASKASRKLFFRP